MEIAPVQLPEAESFAESYPPNNAKEVDRINVNGTTYIYYKDDAGKLYYSTERGLEFAKKMEQVQKQMRQEKMSQPVAAD